MEAIRDNINEIFKEEFSKYILKKYSASEILHSDNTMTKYVDGKFVRKEVCRRKDWSYDWIENVKQEDIDTEYYNLDYTRKNENNRN